MIILILHNSYLIEKYEIEYNYFINQIIIIIFIILLRYYLIIMVIYILK